MSDRQRINKARRERQAAEDFIDRLYVTLSDPDSDQEPDEKSTQTS